MIMLIILNSFISNRLRKLKEEDQNKNKNKKNCCWIMNSMYARLNIYAQTNNYPNKHLSLRMSFKKYIPPNKILIYEHFFS